MVDEEEVGADLALRYGFFGFRVNPELETVERSRIDRDETCAKQNCSYNRSAWIAGQRFTLLPRA